MALDTTQHPCVTVVIPVYEPGELIEACIASLQAQTLREIELIFVDDCGSDSSMDAVRAAAENDARIRVLLNPHNMGPGPSRNRGIEAARGEYLSFVDADDRVSPNFLELLYKKAMSGGFDIVKGTLVTVVDGVGHRRSAYNASIEEGLARGEALYNLFYMHHWTGLYRRQLVLQGGVRFGSSRNFEDKVFLLRAACDAKSFALEGDAEYIHNQYPGTLSQVFTAQRLASHSAGCREIFDYVLDRLVNDKTAEEYVYRLARDQINLAFHMMADPAMKTDVHDFLDELRSELNRLPFVDTLRRDHVDVAALVAYGEALVSSPYYTEMASVASHTWERIVENWDRIALEHPSLFEDNPSGACKAVDLALCYSTLHLGDDTGASRLLAYALSEKKRLGSVFGRHCAGQRPEQH